MMILVKRGKVGLARKGPAKQSLQHWPVDGNPGNVDPDECPAEGKYGNLDNKDGT